MKYSYTVELGDTGEHGFILPDIYIEPTGEDVFRYARGKIGKSI